MWDRSGVPVLFLSAEREGVGRDAGVVAKNAEGPFLGLDVVEHRLDRVRFDDVQNHAAAALRRQTRADPGGPVRRRGGFDDSRALPGKAIRRGPPHTPRGAGGQANLSLQHTNPQIKPAYPNPTS